MDIRIATNIRTFRKERKLTQEQLAESLGVTVGAVSKWESGQSVPDILLIVEMAAFFETSVDVLLGYQMYKDTVEETVERIRELRNAKRFDEAATEAERALLKYPNNFELAFRCAVTYSLKGVEEKSDKAYQRALTLFNRSLELIGQNTDVEINQWTIKNYIASVYTGLGRTEEAVEQLKQNNADGLNNGEIGYLLAADLKRPDQALPYLCEALIDHVSDLFRVTLGYCNAYGQQEDWVTADAILEWMYTLTCGLKRPGASSYLDRQALFLLIIRAANAAQRKDMTAARELLMQAHGEGMQFDTMPNYGFEGMRFFAGTKKPTAFDDFGTSALEGVKDMLSQQAEPMASTLLAIWNALEA